MAGAPGVALALLAGIAQAAAHEIGVHNAKREHEEHDDHDDVTISHVDTNSLNLIIVLVLIAILAVLIVVVSVACTYWCKRLDGQMYAAMAPCGKDMYRPILCHPESCLESIGQSCSCHCDKGADKSRACRWHNEVLKVDSSEVCIQCASQNHQGKKRKKVYRTEVSLTKLTPEKTSRERAIQVDMETSTVPGPPNSKRESGNDTLFGTHRNEISNPDTVILNVVPHQPGDRPLVRSQSAESSLHRGRHNEVARPANGLAKKSSKDSASSSDPGLKRVPSTYKIVHVTTPHQFKPIVPKMRDIPVKQAGSTEFQLTKEIPIYTDDTSIFLRTNPIPPTSPRQETTHARHVKVSLLGHRTKEEPSSDSSGSESNSESLPDPEVAAHDSQSARSSRGQRASQQSLKALKE